MHDESDEAQLNADTALELPLSCLEILANDDAAPSGWYDIQIANSVRTLYCDMDTDGELDRTHRVVAELDGCGGLTGAEYNRIGCVRDRGNDSNDANRCARAAAGGSCSLSYGKGTLDALWLEPPGRMRQNLLTRMSMAHR